MWWSTEFKIYNTKDWIVIKDFSEDYEKWMYCKNYDEKNNSLEFTLPDNNKGTYLYNFDSWKIE